MHLECKKCILKMRSQIKDKLKTLDESSEEYKRLSSINYAMKIAINADVEYDKKGECPKCGDKSNPFTAYVPEKGIFVICKKCRKVFKLLPNKKLQEVRKNALPKSLRDFLKSLQISDKLSVAG